MATTPDGQIQSVWNIRVGSTFKKHYNWAAGTPPLPVNLSTWKARCEIYAKDGDPEPLMTLTTENGGIALDALGNIDFEIGFGEDGTKKFSALKKAVADVELTNGDQTFRRNLIGITINVFAERTKG